MFDIDTLGSRVAFTGQDRFNESMSTGWKIYLTDLKSNKTVHLSDMITARTQQPKFSPNDRKLAFLAMDRDDIESDRLKLMVYDFETKQLQDLTGFVDTSVNDFMWMGTEIIMFTTLVRGTVQMFSINLSSPDSLSAFYRDNFLSTVSVPKKTNPNFRFVMKLSSWSSPEDLYIVSPFKSEQVTNLNPSLAAFNLSKPMLFEWPSALSGQQPSKLQCNILMQNYLLRMDLTQIYAPDL